MKKLNYGRTILIGLAFFSICAFWQVFDNIIPLMLKESFGLRDAATNSIMALDNILALFLLPFFGSLSDRTNTRYGKRTPYIILGTVFAVILMMFLPVASNKNSLIMFFIALGLVLLAMGSYRSPAVALMPDLTPKRHRSKANAIINLMGALGGIYTLVCIRLLVPDKENPSYTLVFLAVAILMVVSVTILKLTINEKKLSKQIKAVDSDFEDEPVTGEKAAPLPKEVRKSLILILSSIFLWFCAYNAVITAYSRYAKEVWGITGGAFADSLMIATGAAVVSYIPIGFIATRFGRKRTILAGICMMFVAFSTGFFITKVSPVIYIVFVLTGIGWAAINVNSYPMVVEMSKGSNIGKYTGYYYTFSMAAQIFTPILSGFFLEVSYRTLFPYAAVFMVLAFITFTFVKHGDSKPVRKKDLIENFDIED
ncbi:MAG TPA: MFS transporter [Clostridia bacterium]|jgi:maltose/moltooligosaccharide transporter|nr:SLC45 family MFS transporter [Clostridiaceae bacterium]HOA32187.1 MFS transporter [Clostridia bacterium]HPZ53204.1 MFS transporter [Clostridia bacterium]